MSNINPCMFCGSSEAHVVTDTVYRAVKCDACEGRTGWFRTLEEAIAAWNRAEGEWNDDAWADPPTEEGFYWLLTEVSTKPFLVLIYKTEDSDGLKVSKPVLYFWDIFSQARTLFLLSL